MKFLLVAINAKYIHSNLAVYSLKTYAKSYQDQIAISEFTINHQEDYILEEIFKEKPDVIAFSCYIWNIQYVKDLSWELHRLLPHVPIWVGGPEVSYETEAFLLENPSITGIMMGEGEETFSEVIAHYVEKKCSLEEIRGLHFKNEKGVLVQTAPREVMDMSRIPFCYSHMEDFKNKIIYYETSRGCPFSCSYCLSSVDKRLRFRDVSLVKKELLFFIEQEVPQVKFVDRTFNCNRRHALEIWKFLIEQDRGITNFHFEIAADLLKEEELALMKTMRPGLIQLEIGVQSTHLKTIEEIDRVMDFSALTRIVERIQEGNNIHQHLDLIAGLPYEDYETFQNSYNEVYSLHPEQLQLGFLKVLKGSKMHQKAEEYGIAYKRKPPYEVLFTKWLSHEDLLKIKAVEEMTELYYNSGQFTKTLRYMESLFDTPFAMFEELAAFYEKSGLSGMSHARITRYQILLAFLTEYHPAGAELAKELLLFDFYLRENSKSRPDWATDLSIYKEDMIDFYRREEETREFLPEYESYTAKQLSKMTHMEVFQYPVAQEFTNVREWEQAKGTYFVLFDYKNRNPLTSDAKVCMVKSV